LESAITPTGYLAGGALTFADMNVLPMLEIFEQYPRGKELLAKHPALLTYVAKLTARPSFTNTAPPPRP
jgi:glutathione S-transferase